MLLLLFPYSSCERFTREPVYVLLGWTRSFTATAAAPMVRRRVSASRSGGSRSQRSRGRARVITSLRWRGDGSDDDARYRGVSIARAADHVSPVGACRPNRQNGRATSYAVSRRVLCRVCRSRDRIPRRQRRVREDTAR